VHEVARVETAELREEVAAHRHEGPVDPVDGERCAAPACSQSAERRVADEVDDRVEAGVARLPSSALVDEPSARDAGARRSAASWAANTSRRGPNAPSASNRRRRDSVLCRFKRWRKRARGATPGTRGSSGSNSHGWRYTTAGSPSRLMLAIARRVSASGKSRNQPPPATGQFRPASWTVLTGNSHSPPSSRAAKRAPPLHPVRFPPRPGVATGCRL